jgi:hypothetical protein
MKGMEISKKRFHLDVPKDRVISDAGPSPNDRLSISIVAPPGSIEAVWQIFKGNPGQLFKQIIE